MVYTRIAQQSRNDSTAQEFSVLPALREASAARERETPGFDFAPQRTKGQHSPGVFRSPRKAVGTRGKLRDLILRSKINIRGCKGFDGGGDPW